MTPTLAADTGHVTRRSWATTTMLAIVAVLLMLVNGFGAAIMTASFFGDVPSRDQYISSGMACLTTLAAFAAMIWFGAA